MGKDRANEVFTSRQRGQFGANRAKKKSGESRIYFSLSMPYTGVRRKEVEMEGVLMVTILFVLRLIVPAVLLLALGQLLQRNSVSLRTG